MEPLRGCSFVIARDMISHISLPLTDLPLLLHGGHRLCLLLVSSKSCTEAVKGPAVNEDLCLPSYSGPVGCASQGSENRSVPEIRSDFFHLFWFTFLRFSKRSEREKVLVPINS